MFNDVLQTVTVEETIGEAKLKATVRAATWADMTKLESVFLSLVYAVMSNAPTSMFSDMDKVVRQLSTVEVDGKPLESIDSLPVPFVLKLAEAVIEANFTPSNVAAWQSFFTNVAEKIAKLSSEAESTQSESSAS
jgi:hypothetical protein